jgi:hypothetical protein
MSTIKVMFKKNSSRYHKGPPSGKFAAHALFNTLHGGHKVDPCGGERIVSKVYQIVSKRR